MIIPFYPPTLTSLQSPIPHIPGVCVKENVLVSEGCHNKITNSVAKQQKFILSVLEAYL